MVCQVGDLAQFLVVISFPQGGLLNLSALAREAGIRHKRAESHPGMLENWPVSFTYRYLRGGPSTHWYNSRILLIWCGGAPIAQAAGPAPCP